MKIHEPRLTASSTLIVATHNKGKLREIADLLSPWKLQVASAADYQLDEPEETGSTFAENAALKARAATEATGLPALADDSGLAVDALDGAPGIYSARWAGANKDFTAAMQRVKHELEQRNVPTAQWSASFICNLCLCLPNGITHHFEGRINGSLVFPPRGSEGFGYDPIFQPEYHDCTFGEMTIPEKQTLSHRARAMTQFLAFVKKEEMDKNLINK